MKIKNLFLSTVLIFGSSSLTSFLINKKEVKENSQNVNSYKTIDKPILTAQLSTTFPGIVFHIKFDIPPEDPNVIKSIQIIDKTNGETILTSGPSISSIYKIKSIDSDVNFVFSNQSYEYSNMDELENWSRYLNKDNIFKDISYSKTNLKNFDVTELYSYNVSIKCYWSEMNVDTTKTSNSVDNLKLIDSDSKDYIRATPKDDLNLNFITDSGDYYSWIEGEIILDNEYTDIIKNDVTFYYGDSYEKYDSTNFKLEFGNTTDENNIRHYTYKFLLKPYSYNEINKFKIEFNLQYRASLNGDPSSSSVPDKFISKEFIKDISINTTLTTNFSKEQRIHGIDYFNLNYLIENKKPEEETIDDIHISHNLTNGIPIDGFGPDKFKLDNGEFNLNDDIEFSIKSTKEPQIFDDLVMVVAVKDSLGMTHTLTNPIDSFSVDSYQKSNIKPSDTIIDPIDINKTNATINLQINKSELGDDQIDSIFLEGNNQKYTLNNNNLNSSDDNMYLLGQFNVEELKYNTDYTYTLTYNIHTWINDSENGEINSSSEDISFSVPPKDRTKQTIFLFGIDAIILLITSIPIILIKVQSSKNKDSLEQEGNSKTKKTKKEKNKSNFI